MIARIDHTAISVPDLDRALAFYCDLLGFEIEINTRWENNADNDTVIGARGTVGKNALIKAGGTRIELFEYVNPIPQVQDAARPVWDHGITHLCFAVDDIHAEYSRLKTAGVVFNSEPVAMGRWYFVYGRDPFGNIFELKQR